MAQSAKIGSIFAEIRAKLDSYDKDLKEARRMTESQMGGLQKSIDKLSFDKAGNSVMDFAKKAAAAFAAFKVADLVKDATMAAARYETLGVVLDRLSVNTAYTKDELRGFEEQLRKTGIAGLEARQVMSMMIQSNLDLSKSTDLARVAQDAAVIANLNSSETLQRMVHAIQANSVEIMRTIGMNVSFEAATIKLAKSLGKTTEQLTEAEKLQARMNATLEAGANISGAYEASMKTAAKQIKSFERYVSDFEVEFGKAFNPALTQIVFGASEALRVLTDAVKDPQFQSSMTKMANDLAVTLVDGMKWMVANKDDVGKGIRNIGGALGEVVSVMGKLPMEAWGAILGFKAAGVTGAIIGTGAALAYRTYTNIPTELEELQLARKALKKELTEGAINWETGNISAAEITVEAFMEGLKRSAELRDRIDALMNTYPAAELEKPFKYYESGRTGSIFGTATPGPEPPSKEIKAKIDKFWEDYKKATSSVFEFEKFKLDKSLEEWKGYIENKKALNTMYYMKLMELKTKELVEEAGRMAEPRSEAMARENLEKRIDLEKKLAEQKKKQLSEIASLDEAGNQERWFQTYVEGVEEATRANEIFNDTMNIMAQNASNAFSEFVTGTKSAKDAFTQMVQSMIAAMTRMASQKSFEMIFGKLMGMGGSLVSSYFGGSTPTGMGSGAGVPWGPKTGDWAAVAHSGGIVGEGLPKRRVPSWIFEGAPRLHGGLRPNERPVIMEDGEEVIPKSRVRLSRIPKSENHFHFYPNSQGQYDRESVSEAQARLFSTISRANQRNR